VSVTTALLLWPLIPKALALPSPSALRETNAELEKALIEKDRALRQISALLDSAPDATIFVDRAGTIVRTNLQTERLLGYSTRDIINKPVEMLLPPTYREHFF
jgi:PAS domain-containing protein